MGRVRRTVDQVAGGAGSIVRRPRFMRGTCLESAVRARTVATERLELRPHRIEDAAAWFRLVSDPRVTRNLSWPERDLAAARRHLRDRTRHTMLLQSDDILALAVTREGELIGDVTLQLRTVASEIRAIEVGWLIDPEHQGNGYAAEAARAMLQIAFDEVHARVALAVIDQRNTESLALARRLGFTELHSGPSHLLTATPEALRAS